MKIFNSTKAWQTFRQQDSFFGKKIGFVPTMGNLHKGHESLLLRAVEENDFSVLSIFVNPTQFNNVDDLKKYPRTLEQDLAIAEQCNVDYVLVPEYDDLYPDNYSYQLNENKFSGMMEGAMRPGHFSGMLTVVLKLLLLIKPQRIYLGEKDYQQLSLIEGMIRAFFLEVDVISCETIRDDNGLALSSRNARLSAEQYQRALSFPKILQKDTSIVAIEQELNQAGLRVEYVQDHRQRRFAAVRIGEVRLIDNFRFSNERG